MTRKEEIVDAAKKAAEEVYSYTFQGMDDLIGLFKAGAEWADAHPVHYDGKAYLYVLHKGVEQGKEEMLEKAIEWLRNETMGLMLQPKENSELVQEFIDSFKEAMKDN